MKKEKDLSSYYFRIGQKFGKLTITEIPGRNPKNNRVMAKCKCECGNDHYVELRMVINGKVGSCGCSRKMYKGICHRSQERLYKIYHGIKERCFNPLCPNYHNYGGRGISMCDEWNEDYSSFREWALQNGYADNLSIDRIDVNGGYSPNNCRWVTWIEQCNNKRENINITYNGETHTATEWSRITGIDVQRIIHRYKRNFPLDIVFSQKRLASRGKYGKRENDSNTVFAKEA